MRFALITIFILVIVCSIKCTNTSEKGKSRFVAKSSLDSSDLNKLAATYAHGKDLFKKYCNACHSAREKKVTDQFIFDNIFERLPTPSEEYFIKFIQDSKLLKSSGDKYAQDFSKDWSSSYEHYFKDSLEEKDFDDLIVYIKVAAKQKNK